MKAICKRLFWMLLVLFCVMGLSISVYAAQTDTDTLRLRNADESGNTAFSVTNMFPGDAETKDFTIKVSHKKPITLYYHADIRPGFEKLAEVMMVKIYLPDREELLYDGLMRDMPSALACDLAADEKEVVYRITAYLDTSVGNDYQYKSLIADFRWWFTEEAGGGGFPWFPEWPDAPYPAPVKLVAEKLLDGRYPRGKDFTFLLWDANGNEIARVRNRDGLVEFPMFYLSQPGSYIYYITELPGDDADMLYDATRYQVTVHVTLNGDRYVAHVCYEKNGDPYTVLPRFVNRTYKPETETADTMPEETKPETTPPSTDTTEPEATPAETKPDTPETNPPDDTSTDAPTPGTPGSADGSKPDTDKPTQDPPLPDTPDTSDETREPAETVPDGPVDMPDNPKTGDRELWFLQLALLLAGLACLWLLAGKRRKQ